MIAQTIPEKAPCPHCWGKQVCDCRSCGLKVKYIDFGGKWFKYYESGTCRVCGGTGIQSPKD